MDLRERIIGAWKNGDGTWEEIAEHYGVGVATVDRLVARYRATGSVAPTVQKSGCDPLLDADALVVVERILRAEPDITLPELRQELEGQTGIVVSVSTVGRAVRERLGWTRKKDRGSHGARPREGDRCAARILRETRAYSARNSRVFRHIGSSSWTRLVRTSR
jgi:transposase